MKHWIQAARLRTLPLSLSGIITGSFLAASKGVFRWDICVLALLTTVGFQVLSNFANDYGDGVKGTDNENRIGPKRALQSGIISPKQMLKGIYITIGITLLIALLLIYVSFGKENFTLSITFFFLGLASIGAAIKYTMGKGAYGYSGFGDLFVFLFFGLLGVVGSEFLFTHQIDILSFLPAMSIGLFSVGVLNLNNMRDRVSDIQSQKNTMAVKLGVKKAKVYHYFILIIGMLSVLSYVLVMNYSFKAYLFLIAFIPLVKHIKVVYKNKEAVLLDPELKKVALSTFLFSILFGLGLLI
ncbi:1,4-dihydroxy-2-naphthoate octaprenyltransferase [Wenyingzhuangia sp. IMCC45467]